MPRLKQRLGANDDGDEPAVKKKLAGYRNATQSSKPTGLIWFGTTTMPNRLPTFTFAKKTGGGRRTVNLGKDFNKIGIRHNQ